jgi:hypothetical protein
MSLNAPAFVADGNINPSVFVEASVSTASTPLQEPHVLQATSADVAGATKSSIILGVSQPGTRDAPGTVGASGLAAAAGQTVQVYGIADVCMLKIGSGGCTIGDLLTPDTSGQGTTVTRTTGGGGATAVPYGAIALETANSGELCRVLVTIGYITPA